MSDELLHDLEIGYQGTARFQPGSILAKKSAIPSAFLPSSLTPVVVDELEPIARYSGCPETSPEEVFSMRSTRGCCQKIRKGSGIPYEQLNPIVVHMGGGCSVGAHRGGKDRGCQQHS